MSRKIRVTEWRTWWREIRFDLSKGAMEVAVHDATLVHGGGILISQIEGRARSRCSPAACVPDNEMRALLEDTVVRVEVGSRPVWEASAALVTPFDSALEARVREIELLLEEIVGSRDKMKDALLRLGWERSSEIDNRRMSKPIWVPPHGEYAVRVRRPSNPAFDIEWTCILGGVEKLAIG